MRGQMQGNSTSCARVFLKENMQCGIIRSSCRYDRQVRLFQTPRETPRKKNCGATLDGTRTHVLDSFYSTHLIILNQQKKNVLYILRFLCQTESVYGIGRVSLESCTKYALIIRASSVVA